MPDYITARELEATVKPIRDDISEIKGDVKTLLADQAARRAFSTMRNHMTTTITAIVAGSAGAVAAFVLHI